MHAGDICYQGQETEVQDFLNWFSQLNYRFKIFIAGNHDFFMERAKPARLKKMIPENICYLKDSGVEFEGLKFWGSPVTPWFFNWAFNKHRGAAMKKHWELIPSDTEILITHGPAFGILDTVINEQHVGCKDLLNRVKEIQPKVHIFGHIHEAYGNKRMSGTRFYNACVLNECYELVNKPFVVEL